LHMQGPMHVQTIVHTLTTEGREWQTVR
jgi:hypothetical protein